MGKVVDENKLSKIVQNLAGDNGQMFAGDS